MAPFPPPGNVGGPFRPLTSILVISRVDKSHPLVQDLLCSEDVGKPISYYPGNKEGHIPTRSASEGPMKSSESRRGSPLDD